MAEREELTSTVRRAQAGDLEAYGWIVRRFQDMAVGYAASILGDFHLAEDAAQEAFLEVWRDLAQLRERRYIWPHFHEMERDGVAHHIRHRPEGHHPPQAAAREVP